MQSTWQQTGLPILSRQLKTQSDRFQQFPSLDVLAKNVPSGDAVQIGLLVGNTKATTAGYAVLNKADSNVTVMQMVHGMEAVVRAAWNGNSGATNPTVRTLPALASERVDVAAGIIPSFFAYGKQLSKWSWV
jgi:hypothetical protein